jgi:hypothetical protein
MLEQVNQEIRGDLFEKVGAVMVVLVSVLIPSVWLNDRGSYNLLNKGNFVYDDKGYITKIRDNRKKTIWQANKNHGGTFE